MKTTLALILASLITACGSTAGIDTSRVSTKDQRAGHDTYQGPLPPLQPMSDSGMGPLYQIPPYSKPIW